MTLQKELENLNEFEVVDISEKIDDYIVPVEVAAKLKGVSRNSILEAIRRGVLRRVDGVTMSSLVKYRVDSNKRTSGKIRGIQILEEKIKKLEEEKLVSGNGVVTQEINDENKELTK